MKHLIGILGYNNQARVDKCAASVLADMPEGSDVVLLDNGTTPLLGPPGTVTWHVAEITRGGFTAALRWFLEQGMAKHYDSLTFLNDDITLEAGALRAMIDYAILQPHVAVANPAQVDMYNPQIVICAGTGKAYPAGIHKTGQRGTFPMPVEDARWMPFCATTFNPAAVRDIGMPDPNMRIWFSDSDYCIRARLQGWRVVCLGETAVVRHEHSASVKEMPDEARRHAFEADQTACARKWGGGILAEYST